MQRSNSLLALAGFGAAVAGAAWFGSRYNPKDLRTRLWYSRLKKPKVNPPEEIFPVVWGALYSLMALSAWRVWQRRNSPERSRALRMWVQQLLTNAGWTRTFFGKHRPRKALVQLLLLEMMILRYMKAAKDVDRGAATAFIPYAIWIAFAGYLNSAIVLRNPNAAEQLPLPRAA